MAHPCTTALLGFYYQSKYYVCYQEINGEPSGLGKKIVQEITDALEKEQYMKWKERFLGLKIVTDNDIPTQEDMEKLKDFTDLELVAKNWFCLTYHSKNSLSKILESGYLYNYVDDTGFPYFQDYAYILNLDSDMLDFYEYTKVIQSYYLTHMPNW